MKASVKFREDQKPLLRAKVPLSILGLPFQSGIVAGESKELTLNLGTFFESGPSIRVGYRPNDTSNPFSLVVKTGTGSFGSPISSSMLMSAEFNLLGSGKNPTFMLHFKPQFGDFSIKKSQSSVFQQIVGHADGVVSAETPAKIPFLVMNKIGIEHVDVADSKAKTTKAAEVEKGLTFPGNAEVAEACFTVKRQLEALQSENGLLRKAVEDLRQEIAGATKSISSSGNIGGRNSGGKVDWRSNSEKRSSEGDVSE
ncbi:hypothetical protein ACE6H2_023793 [Prunus campanulata]